MNYVYLSPEFPPNYAAFIQNLRENGVNVLGIGIMAFDHLNETVKRNLTEYYRVSDLHNYDELLRAMGYFIHGYGKLDFVESHNEYWLETEANLRTDFNIPGPKRDTIAWTKQKSKMKQIYTRAGIKVARGRVLKSLAEAQTFVKETGFPVIAKPDNGVGAAATFKIGNQSELRSFFENRPHTDYIFEEFIKGDIFSFDGLTNQEGEVIFYTVHVFSNGIMETVNQDDDIFYYSLREIPEQILETGMRTVKAFDVKARFFHLEFFETATEDIVALEVNIRPPGGFTTDMFNYAHDYDIYAEYANMIAGESYRPPLECPYHCAYISRKNHIAYQLTHHQVLSAFSELIVQHDPISPIWRNALGDYGYIVRSPDLDQILSVVEQIQQKRIGNR